ncbi:26S proteasome non-ATPase regulatory subunit 5 [Gongronella butleri]|nr:26S proteasome non-ATPase regulatory subunit 5 [Gongronella butleri]
MPVPSYTDINKVLSQDSTYEEKLAALQLFNASLGDQVSLDEANGILQQLPPEALYAAVTLAADTDAESPLVVTLCTLVVKIFAPVPYAQLTAGHSYDYLVEGLRHFSRHIRLMTLQLVEKCLATADDTKNMLQSSLVHDIVASIGFQETNVAQKASSLLYQACAKPGCLDVFFASNAILLLKQLVNVRGAVSFRVYELFINIAGLSDAALAKGEECGILLQLRDELNSNDTMIRLNAVESLSELATNARTVSALINSHILDKLNEYLDSMDTDSIDDILIKSAALKIFGNMYSIQDFDSACIEQQYAFLSRLPTFIQSDVGNIQEVALAVVGLVGSHAQGLALLEQRPEIMDAFFDATRYATGVIKTTGLQSLSKILGVTSRTEAERIDAMTFAVFQAMPDQPNSLKNLLSTVRQPVDPVRFAAFALLESIASHPWGVEAISHTFELLGYLLDRSNEHERTWQEWKFSVVKQLVDTGSEAVLGRHYAMLQMYVRQGPYHRDNQVLTAMESG